MITRDQLLGNWNDIVGSIKEKFGDFSAGDLARVQGNFEELVGLIQRKSGQSRDQIALFLTECCESAGSTYGRVANRASQYIDSTGETMNDQYGRIVSEAKKGLDYTAQSVGRRPLESLAIAVGSGVIAGVLLGLSLSNRKR